MDVVQNTFRAALPKIGDLRPKSAASLLHWLSIIATNQIRDGHDYQRAARRDVGRVVSLDLPSNVGGTPTPVATSSSSPQRAAELEEVRCLLDEAVAGLPEDQRRVVVLRDFCGESWERIAAELDREQGAARQLHQRAWIRLRRTLVPKIKGMQ
jgi:RNA polymerase sigma factor (sigma-70 family)